jgi:hypothetical protein
MPDPSSSLSTAATADDVEPRRPVFEALSDLATQPNAAIKHRPRAERLWRLETPVRCPERAAATTRPLGVSGSSAALRDFLADAETLHPMDAPPHLRTVDLPRRLRPDGAWRYERRTCQAAVGLVIGELQHLPDTGTWSKHGFDSSKRSTSTTGTPIGARQLEIGTRPDIGGRDSTALCLLRKRRALIKGLKGT